jgi:hypothetical protein
MLSPPPAMDDSRSATLHEDKNSSPPSRDGEKSAAPSLNEKHAEAEGEPPVPVLVAEQMDEQSTEHYNYKEELHTEAEKAEMGNELKQIQTSESGIEYPSGLRLNLISLALCLSVFLMALVCPRPVELTFNILIEVG